MPLTPLALALAVAAGAADLSLEQAIGLALGQNRELLRAQTLLEQGRAEVDAASGAFDAVVSPLASLQSVGGQQVTTLGLAASKRFSLGTSVSASASWGDAVFSNGALLVQPAVSLSITQPLFRNAGTAVNLSGVRSAESAVVTARRRHEQLRQELVSLVVARFTELFRLQQQVKVDELSLRRATDLVHLNEAYLLAGRSKRLDTLRAGIKRDGAEAALGADRQREASAQADLAELLGVAQPSSVLAQPAGFADFRELEPGEALRSALTHRLDYAQALQDAREAARLVEVAGNQQLPEVDLTVGYQRFLDPPVPGGAIPSGGGVFVGLRGSGQGRSPAVRAALRGGEAAHKAALQNVRILEARIARDVEKSVGGYRQARTEYAIAERATASAEARRRLARMLFELGRTDSFSVADAEQGSVEAQAALLTSNAEVTRAGYRLSDTLGTLLEPPDDLKPERAVR